MQTVETMILKIQIRINHLSQCTTKPTIIPVWPAKTDQPINLVRVLVYHSLDSPEAVEGTCDQRWLWSDCADAQTDLSLRWPYKSYCKFCRALAHFSLSYNKTWFLLKVNFKRTDNFVWSVSTKSAVYFIYVSFFSPIPIVIYLFPSPIHDLYTYMYSTF